MKWIKVIEKEKGEIAIVLTEKGLKDFEKSFQETPALKELLIMLGKT